MNGRDKKYLGNFKCELQSNYDYRAWTTVEISCVSYTTFKRIVEAISPILDDEKCAMEKWFESQEE